MGLSLSPATLFLAVFWPKERAVCVQSRRTHTHTHSLAGHTIIQSHPAHSRIYFLRFMPLSGACSSLC